jgi:aldehyde:ferredoxin oxidoreductase
MFGWTGKLLRVDLSSQQIKEESIPQRVLSAFIGGKGLGTYFLYTEVPARIDALNAENRFYLVAGPLQGTRIPISGRCTAISKSPLTQLYIDSAMGGHLGPELKRAGYDLLAIQGRAEKPVWIHISEDEVAIKSASYLWGKSTHETEHMLQKENPKIQVLSTGPAGEHLVRFACLTHNYFRNFGRGGLGTIFGAKNLKAVAIQGAQRKIPTPDADKELELVKQLVQRARRAKKKGHSLHYTGTPWLLDYANNIGMFPTRNFQTTYFENHTKINDASLDAIFHNQKHRTPCEGCIISCAWTLKHPTYSWVDQEYPGKVALPEYETLGLLGGNLGIDDLMMITQANYLCNRLGLDTISTGNVIGFLMELTQRNLLPQALQSAEIQFGDTQGVIELITKIAIREGIGNSLALGVRELSNQLGPETEPFALHTKGLEYPAWDPRGKLGMGLSYVTAAAGASHLRGWPSTEKPPEDSATTVLDSLIEQQNLKILKDALIICHFTHSISPRLDFHDCVALYSVVTGQKATVDSINQAANRTWMLARMFNIREYDDIPRNHDVLPARFMDEPVPDGPTKGYTAFISQQDFDDSLTELYARRGCNAEGFPTTRTLRDLELTNF